MLAQHMDWYALLVSCTLAQHMECYRGAGVGQATEASVSCTFARYGGYVPYGLGWVVYVN